MAQLSSLSFYKLDIGGNNVLGREEAGSESYYKFNALLGSCACSRRWDARPLVPRALRVNARGPVTTSQAVTRPEQPRNLPWASAGRSAVSMAWRPPAQHLDGSHLW